MSRNTRRAVRRLIRDAENIQTDAPQPDAVADYVNDPVGFMRALVDPETGSPFIPYAAEVRFLERAFVLNDDGRLPYPELVFSAPKKSGKTALAAVALLYVTRVIGGKYAEAYCYANDFDQAQGRVFTAADKIITASPLLNGTADITKDRIQFGSGAFVQALASDYQGAAGSAPSISVFDELWGYIHERANRLWDESVPVPTRKVSCRLTVTYAGFEGESALLESLHKKGKAGTEIAPDLYEVPDKVLMYWTHQPVAPWQTPEWLEQMRDQLRPSAFTRMIENRFTAGESAFVDLEWWDACVHDDLHPILEDKGRNVWVGVDASTKRDSTAVVVVGWDEEHKRVELLRHWVFQPSPDKPLDFEATVERTLIDVSKAFRLRCVRFDPYQLVSVAQRLTQAGIRMEEFPQTTGNLTEASSNLYDLIKGKNLAAYPDKDIRLAVSRAVAIENPRGWRIAKQKTSHKIDVVVALGMGALACVQDAQKKPVPLIGCPAIRSPSYWSGAGGRVLPQSQAFRESWGPPPGH